MQSGRTVKIVECPRDAWQGLPGHIPPQTKAHYLRALIEAGFRHLDAVSFVSPTAVPQMADSEQVLQLLRPPAGVEIIGIVVNEKGAERAMRTGAVTTLGFPYSVSPGFLARNQGQTQEQALRTLESIASAAAREGLGTVAYISMAFGNPYGEPWSAEEVISACVTLAELGAGQISLADTVGVATEAQIGSLVGSVHGALDGLPGSSRHSPEVGVHLHARPEQAKGKIAAALQAGCRRLDTAIGGLGGCPFAQDDLVGNVPTEVALAALEEQGMHTPLHLAEELLAMNRAIAESFSIEKYAR